MNYYILSSNELYHHGIKGQKWGVKNGPPYPLNRKKSGNYGMNKVKRLSNGPEDIETATKNANPNADKMKNSCVPNSIAAYLRSEGISCTSKGSGGKQLLLGGVIEECFENSVVFDGSAVKFGKSREDAESFLKKRFGDNAKGNVSIQWIPDNDLGAEGGHAFNWEIKDGNVAFSNQLRDNKTIDDYWKYINQNDSLTVCRLDQSKPKMEKLRKWINFED